MEGKSQCVLGSAMRKLILNSEILLNASIGNGVVQGRGGGHTRPGWMNEYFKQKKILIFCAQQIFK